MDGEETGGRQVRKHPQFENGLILVNGTALFYCPRLWSHTRMPVTENEFRELALSLDGAVEASHMGHADFRVGDKIFATLPKKDHGMVKLPPADQARLIDPETETFMPAAGAWGRQGCTIVKLKQVAKPHLEHAMKKAWENARTTSPSPRSKGRKK